MRVILLGGAPGIGKSTVARELLVRAQPLVGRLVQWVDVDGLWLHQPWRVDDRMKGMLHRNLAAVLRNAAEAGVDDVVVTWVYQSADLQHLVRGLAPQSSEFVSVQLTAAPAAWRERFAGDPNRPGIDAFFEGRYRDAAQTPADHRVSTDDLNATEVAALVAGHIGW